MQQKRVFSASKDFNNRFYESDDWEKSKNKKHISSTIVTIKEIFNEQLVASIIHPTYSPDGDVYVPYMQEAGLIKGSLARMDIHSGAPIITSVVKFGTDVKETTVIDLDPSSKKPLKKGDAPEYGNNYSNIAFEKFIILCKEGEKAYQAGLSAIKLGIDHLVITLGGKASLLLNGSTAEIRGSNSFLSSDYCSSSANTEKDGSSFLASRVEKKNDKEDDDIVAPKFREYKGDCIKGLEADNINIINIPNKLPDLKKAVYLKIVFDEDVEKYDTEIGNVTSKYKNRKLTVSGDLKDITINKRLKSRTKLNFKGSKAGKASFGDIDLAITYFKCITIEGDTIYFQTGKNNKLILNDSIDIRNKKTNISLGDYIDISQKDRMELDYPVQEKSIYIQDRYQRQIISNYSRIISKDYVQTNKKAINSVVEYEIDSESKIDTMELLISPKKIIEGCYIQETLSEAENIKVRKTLSMKNKKGNSYSSNVNIENDVSVTKSGSSGSDSFSIYESSKSFSISGPKVFFTDAKQSSFGGLVSIQDKLFVGKGIYGKGDFFIESNNIQMSAVENIVMETKGVVYTEAGRVFSRSKGDIAFVTESGKSDKDDGNVAPMILIGDTIQLYSNSISLYGKKSANLVSDEFVSLGAKEILIPGYVRW